MNIIGIFTGREETETDTERRLCEDREGLQKKDNNEMTEYTGVMQLQTTQDCQQPPEASREVEQILPRRNQSHQQPDSELLASKTVRK